MIPQPVYAVLLLFPITKNQEKWREDEEKQLEAKRAKGEHKVHPSVYFCKQFIPNACGTIGLLHILSNLSADTGGCISLPADCWTSTFLAATASSTPEQRAEALEADSSLEAEHAAVVEEGQSAVIDDAECHFAAYLCKDGELYELDGRKSGPINHGKCKDEELLAKAAALARKAMDRDPANTSFALVALAAHDGVDDEEEEEEEGAAEAGAAEAGEGAEAAAAPAEADASMADGNGAAPAPATS